MRQVCCILFATCLSAVILAAPAGAQDQTFGFANVTVFDGERVIPNASVHVKDGLISAVGPDIDLPLDILVYEGEGRTLLPGFIDAHAHTPFRGMAETALLFGTTTLLDMHTSPETAREFHDEQRAGRASDRADVFSAGSGVTVPGGHGTQFGFDVPTLSPDGDPHAFVADRVAEGADFIKVVYDDGSVYGLAFPTFEPETIAEIIGAAHAHDRMAVVHVGRLRDARVAVAAGADGLVHVWSDELPTDEDIDLVLRRRTFVVPTLAVMASVWGGRGGDRFADDERAAPWLRQGERERLRQTFSLSEGVPASYEHAMGSVARLAAAGVPILAGTDAPNSGTAHGVSMHHELQLLAEAGLSPVEALRAATSAPADAFGLDDRGRIAPGLRADLLLVDGDPTTDLNATLDIAGVWKGGHAVDRETIRARLATEVGPGPVSTFDDGTLATSFGVDWTETTDQSMGGVSTVDLEVVEGGAEGRPHALRISGQLGDAGPFQWSGIVVFPGGDPMTGADLSATRGLRFQVRGDSGDYAAMVFSPSHGFAPILRAFDVGEEWAEASFTWEDFGIEPTNVTGIGIVAGGEARAFTIYVDEVELH